MSPPTNSLSKIPFIFSRFPLLDALLFSQTIKHMTKRVSFWVVFNSMTYHVSMRNVHLQSLLSYCYHLQNIINYHKTYIALFFLTGLKNSLNFTYSLNILISAKRCPLIMVCLGQSLSITQDRCLLLLHSIKNLLIKSLYQTDLLITIGQE